jgi:hypothetical protein
MLLQYSKIKIFYSYWVWWYMPVIPVLGRLRQEDQEFEANVESIVRPCLQ